MNRSNKGRSLVPPDFNIYNTSFGPCEWGELKSPIWLCDLCPDFRHTQHSSLSTFKDFSNVLPNAISIEELHPTFQDFCFSLFQGIELKSVSKNLFNTSQEDFFCEIPICLLNLFPINLFHSNESSHYWIDAEQLAVEEPCGSKKSMADWTGLPSIEFYKEWCLQRRAAIYQDLLEKNLPNLIVCNGLDSQLEYLRFWGGRLDGLRCLELPYINTNSVLRISYSTLEKGNSETLLVITDFHDLTDGHYSFQDAAPLGIFLRDIYTGLFGHDLSRLQI